MRLIVNYNWDINLVDRLDKNSVAWVSGRLTKDRIGSCNTYPANLRRINNNQIKMHIDKVHRKGLKFNYIINSTCMGDIEYTPQGMKGITDQIKWLINLGVDGVTVSHPFLPKIIRNYSKNIRIGLDISFMFSWCKYQDDYFNNPHVNWIILPTALNRDMIFLKELSKRIKYAPWLVVNSGCLYQCPFVFEHANYLSHISNGTSPFIDTNYFHLHCRKLAEDKPHYILGSRWIRPEDLKKYEEMGYQDFVILQNSPSSEEILKIATSYSNRNHEGNLLDILSWMGKKNLPSNNRDKDVYLDNKRMDKFIADFPSINCAGCFCDECGYCISAAKDFLK